jgi:hypothetical protein
MYKRLSRKQSGHFALPRQSTPVNRRLEGAGLRDRADVVGESRVRMWGGTGPFDPGSYCRMNPSDPFCSGAPWYWPPY